MLLAIAEHAKAAVALEMSVSVPVVAAHYAVSLTPGWGWTKHQNHLSVAAGCQRMHRWAYMGFEPADQSDLASPKMRDDGAGDQVLQGCCAMPVVDWGVQGGQGCLDKGRQVADACLPTLPLLNEDAESHLHFSIGALQSQPGPSACYAVTDKKNRGSVCGRTTVVWTIT